MGLWDHRKSLSGAVEGLSHALEGEAHSKGCFLSRTRGCEVGISVGVTSRWQLTSLSAGLKGAARTEVMADEKVRVKSPRGVAECTVH